jgi:hypothetical protein
MAAQGAELQFGPPEQLAKTVADEHIFWRDVVKRAGIPPQ